MIRKALHATKGACLCISAGVVLVLFALTWQIPIGRQIEVRTHASGAALLERAAEQVAASGAPLEIDLGTIRAGGSAERQFEVTNPGDSPIEITRIETSCDCVSIELPELHIAANQSVMAIARLDLSGERDFTGELCPEIRFFDRAEHSLLTYLLHVFVVRQSRSRVANEPSGTVHVALDANDRRAGHLE